MLHGVDIILLSAPVSNTRCQNYYERSRSSGSLRVFSMPQIMDESVEGLQWRSRESSRGTKPPRSVERGEPPHFAADLEPTTPCAPPYLNCIVHPARTQNSARSVSPRCTAGSLLFRTATRVAYSRILYRCLSYCWLSVQCVCRCACAPPSPSHCAAPPHHHRVTLSMCLVGGSVVQRVEGTVQEYSARDTKSRVQRVYRESRVH